MRWPSARRARAHLLGPRPPAREPDARRWIQELDPRKAGRAALALQLPRSTAFLSASRSRACLLRYRDKTENTSSFGFPARSRNSGTTETLPATLKTVRGHKLATLLKPQRPLNTQQTLGKRCFELVKHVTSAQADEGFLVHGSFGSVADKSQRPSVCIISGVISKAGCCRQSKKDE